MTQRPSRIFCEQSCNPVGFKNARICGLHCGTSKPTTEIAEQGLCLDSPDVGPAPQQQEQRSDQEMTQSAQQQTPELPYLHPGVLRQSARHKS